MDLIWDNKFIRNVKKRIRSHNLSLEELEKNLELFSRNPFHASLRTHKLSGKLKDLWAFSCGYDCRILFKFISETQILLIDIGTHDEIY